MQSKTTLYRKKKIEMLRIQIYTLLYVLTEIKKSELFIIRSSDLKKVLKIATAWKTELIEYRKLSSNSSTEANDLDQKREKS